VKETPGRPDEPRHPAGQWTDVADAGADLTWGVGAVSSRLGVAASTLRTWERRYGIGPSHRTHGGHRRYTERDIGRVELVRRMVARGVSAQDAARVTRHLDRDDLAAALRGESAASELDVGSDDLLDSLLAAATAGDAQRMRVLVASVLDASPVLEAWRDVVSPALCRVAHEVSREAVGRRAEGLLHREVLDALKRKRGPAAPPAQGGVKPQVLMATFVEETRSLPFAAWAAALAQADVVLRVVGPDAGPRAVLDVASRTTPSVVVLWDPPGDSGAIVRRYLDTRPTGALVRASPSWPAELRLRFGAEPREVTGDVGAAVRAVLDRVR
jgi:DNA-binding transcriptional MerR regulator